MDPTIKTTIEQRLIESGEKERLKEHLRNRLIECGWREGLKLHAKEVVKERGFNNVTVEEVVQEITPRARQTVPDVVKQELLVKIQTFLAQQHNM
jgi:enhancer of yellow 2 transcription factor